MSRLVRTSHHAAPATTPRPPSPETKVLTIGKLSTTSAKDTRENLHPHRQPIRPPKSSRFSARNIQDRPRSSLQPLEDPRIGAKHRKTISTSQLPYGLLPTWELFRPRDVLQSSSAEGYFTNVAHLVHVGVYRSFLDGQGICVKSSSVHQLQLSARNSRLEPSFQPMYHKPLGRQRARQGRHPPALLGSILAYPTLPYTAKTLQATAVDHTLHASSLQVAASCEGYGLESPDSAWKQNT